MRSTVLHNDAFHDIRNMLRGISAFFQICIYFAPGDHFHNIIAAVMEIIHALDIQFIRFLLIGIDADDMFLDVLGTLVIREALHQLQYLVTALGDHVYQLQRIRADSLNVVAVYADQNVLNLIRHLINILAYLQDILPVNRCSKGLDKRVEHLMFFAVGGMLYPVHLIKIIVKFILIKMIHDILKQVDRIAGVLRAVGKIVKIISVLFFLYKFSP